MEIRKYKSLPADLNKIDTLLFLNDQHQYYNSFKDLHLKGEQTIVTFGKSTSKSKETRKKIIEYFYKNLYKSKL